MLLLTDHKPMCDTFYRLNLAKSDKQQCPLALLTEQISNIEYIKGTHNVVDDCLSQPPLAVKVNLCDLAALGEAVDIEIHSFHNLKKFNLANEKQFRSCNVSTYYPRPFISSLLHKFIFDSIHAI